MFTSNVISSFSYCNINFYSSISNKMYNDFFRFFNILLLEMTVDTKKIRLKTRPI